MINKKEGSLTATQLMTKGCPDYGSRKTKSQATQLIWILSISYIEVFSRRSSPSAVSLSINWIYCSFSPKMLSEIIHMNWTNLV